MGLFWAPKEAMMGDVGRILYVHVPTAWVALVTFLIAFIAAIGSLWNGKLGWDGAVEAGADQVVELEEVVGALLNRVGAAR